MNEWLRVPGFSRYRVNAHGEVLNVHGRPLKFHLLKGYLTARVWSDDDRRITTGAHRLVALAFHGPCPSADHEVAHGDGVRTNNSASNLRWATRRENAMDKVKHGTNVGRRSSRLNPPDHASNQAWEKWVSDLRSTRSGARP